MVTEPILHVDMDAFYASVEAIKDPALRGRKVVVGGQGARGVVTSASYEARAFGVHSAMPIVTARRLCPDGVFLANDFGAYRRHSEMIRDVFFAFTPLVEPLSLDEAFLDVRGSVRLFGSPPEIAAQVKRRIADLGLRCTVGVAPNKFLAKLGSTVGKPDGLLVVAASRYEDFLHPLPVSALWGVGEQTADLLERLGLKRVGDLARMPRRALQRAVGDALGAQLHDLAQGEDERPVIPYEPPKQVGCEETYERDLDSDDAIVREVLRLSDRAAARARAKGLCGRTITVKIRWSNFQTVTRSRTVGEEVDTAAEIYDVARDLYLRLRAEKPRVRLLGVTLGSLAPGPPRRQLQLVRGSTPGWDRATRAIDEIRGRFGERAVAPAALLERD